MGIGWNLGNTLDCTGSWINSKDPSAYETAWGNPVTTKAMIDKIKEGGFKTVRIPVSWGEHMGEAPEYKVDEAWLNRVKEIVDYCIDNGLYAIVNVHHDSEWCYPSYEKEEEASRRLEKLWTQIATVFKDYDDHLVFETLNEPRELNTSYEWIGGSDEGRDVVNHYNEVALKAIRATGDNNVDRSVMIPTYAASGSSTAINSLKIPEDKHIIVSLHAYSPYFFAMDTSAQSTDFWGTAQDKANLANELAYYGSAFGETPVVIGEFGSINKENTSSRKALASYYVTCARQNKMACIWWDNNASKVGSENFGLFDRANLNWYFPEIHNALVNAYVASK